MSILNDMEIRKLCLVPTHATDDSLYAFLYSKVDDVYYDLEKGSSVGQDIFEKHWKNTKRVTQNQMKRFEDRMITPFAPRQVRAENDKKIISYGTSSMGYDVRLGNKFKIFTNVFNALIDPLNMPESAYVDHEGDFVIIPPNSYVLGHTVEYFRIPRDILTICVGKSTYARAACSVNVTPIEPGFEGNVVIELANQSTLPMKVYANQGIAQFIFLKGNPCETSYADRAGKYQGQLGIQTAIV